MKLRKTCSKLHSNSVSDIRSALILKTGQNLYMELQALSLVEPITYTVALATGTQIERITDKKTTTFGLYLSYTCFKNSKARE